LGNAADELRAMACQDAANRLTLTEHLVEVATAIDEAIHFRLNRGNRQEYIDLVGHCVELATSLKEEFRDQLSLSRANVNELHHRFAEIRRKLDNLVVRLPTLLDRSGGLEEAQVMANALGLELCRYSQHDLDSIQRGLTEKTAKVGRGLHLIGVTF